MELKQLREKSADQLSAHLTDLRKEQFSLRMQIATQQNSDSAQLKRLRRDIARVQTVMNEKAATK